MPAARLDPGQIFQSIADQHQVSLAVSGGSDSMAMLRLAEAWVKQRGGFPHLNVLTVDHGLRSASAAEAARVGEWCRALGLDHVVLEWREPKPQTGIQAKARNARYELMSRWCEDHGILWLLSAHTLEDQAETVLMRLARSASIESLAAIPRVGHWRGTRLLRPLLSTSNSALRQLLSELGQEWIEDPSNQDDRFERARIRKTMPLFAELGITAAALADLADRARDAVDALWGAAQDWFMREVSIHDAGYCTIPLELFVRQPRELKTRILGLVVSSHGAGRMPEPQELELLVAWAEFGGTRRTLGGAIIVRRRSSLLVGREPGRIDPTPVDVGANTEIVWDRRFAVSAPRGSSIVPVRVVADLPRRQDIPAFVQESLPAIMMAGGALAVPQLGLGEGAAARFVPTIGR